MFGERLKELRRSVPGMTQAKLAEMLGVTQQAVGMWERNKNFPENNLTNQIANIFHCTTDYLLGRVDSPNGQRVQGSIPQGQPTAGTIAATLTEQEERLLSKYRALSNAGRDIVDKHIDLVKDI